MAHRLLPLARSTRAATVMAPAIKMACAIAFALGAATAQARPADKKTPQRPDGSPHVIFKTNRGDIVVRLFANKAPISTRNMLDYVHAHFYDGLIFHRVIDDFMMQGGGFDAKLKPRRTRAPIKNEADNGLLNRRGTVAMARTSTVDSATSQFFINFKDNAALDHTPQSYGYAVIGEVVDGMEVVEAIRQVPVRCPSHSGEPCGDALPAGMMDVPKDPIVILRAYRKSSTGRAPAR